MFALVGIVCLLRQRGTPGGRFPCGLALTAVTLRQQRASHLAIQWKGPDAVLGLASQTAGLLLRQTLETIPAAANCLGPKGPSFRGEEPLAPPNPAGPFRWRHVHDRGRTHSPLCGLGLSSGRFCRCLPRGLCYVLPPLYHPLSELFCLVS